MYILLMHVRILKQKSYQLPTVRTYVPHLPGARAPTDVRTYLLHMLLFLLVHERTHRTTAEYWYITSRCPDEAQQAAVYARLGADAPCQHAAAVLATLVL